MSYRIGQIRKDSATSYLTDLSWTKSSIYTAGYAGMKFKDYALYANFKATETYYLRFTIKRLSASDSRFSRFPMTKNSNDPREMDITLQLFESDGSANGGNYELGTYQVIENRIPVEPYIVGQNSQYYVYETMFTPIKRFHYLGFILSRTSYDYTVIARNDISSNINLTKNGDIAIVNNILPLEAVKKIGVQTRPGSLICINKEAIRVGRSGVYEMNNDVPISFVGMAGPNGSDAKNINNFILDYAWNQE